MHVAEVFMLSVVVEAIADTDPSLIEPPMGAFGKRVRTYHYL
ncbi:hypothetical protein [Ferrimicrobium acidiphilum]|jgi:hypothetical protein|nr:hypothetical protein [Ferrimicrobium acidiphilum]